MADAIVVAGGATISALEVQRILDGLDALAKDNHAPREITVTATLHVHHEYPKHVKVGEDKEKNPITKLVSSAAEERAVRAEVAKKEAAEPAPTAT